ncbi:MAG TPA: serine/threonine-protein kinase, partial [Kofleriaceae bacterium]|nr:serine/threonine-protein kinase [Kofleriaceae bacterium]
MLAERTDSLICTMLGKNYRVIERIGSGGMAAVYLVEHHTLLKRFAAKVLSTDLASSLEARARFTQEAHAASQLDHENIVSINDFGVTGDHRPFFVMELLRGQTLDQRIAEGAMTIEEVVAVAVPVARALAHAHAEGIVHRDIKPENIFLVQRSQGRWGVKVVDFGIAKTPINPKLTKMGETLGSPLFMAPEMIRGEDDAVDQRTDVYSFGVLLYLMLCGQLPFSDENLLKVMQMHLSSPPPSPRKINPGMSIELAEIVDRALAKHPDDRYPSMDALLIDLEAALPTGSDRLLIEAQSGASLHDTPFAGALAMSRTLPRQAARPQSPANSAVLPIAPRRSGARLAIAAAGALVVAGGAVAWRQLEAGRTAAVSSAAAAGAVAQTSPPAPPLAIATSPMPVELPAAPPQPQPEVQPPPPPEPAEPAADDGTAADVPAPVAGAGVARPTPGRPALGIKRSTPVRPVPRRVAKPRQAPGGAPAAVSTAAPVAIAAASTEPLPMSEPAVAPPAEIAAAERTGSDSAPPLAAPPPAAPPPAAPPPAAPLPAAPPAPPPVAAPTTGPAPIAAAPIAPSAPRS